MGDQSSTALVSLTSGWKVGPSVRAGDLDKARAVLGSALAAGKSANDLDPAVVSRPIGPSPVPSPASPPTPVVGFTQSALGVTVGNPLAVPAWANGMAQGERLGPFIDQFGNSNFVVTIPLTFSTTFTFSTAANGFAVFPLVGQPEPGDVADARRRQRLVRSTAACRGRAGRKLLRLTDFRRHADIERAGYTPVRRLRRAGGRDADVAGNACAAGARQRHPRR